MPKNKIDLENMSSDERNKVSKLLKENYGNDGKEKDQVSWMYKKEEVEKEDYLLGKTVKSLNEFMLENDLNKLTDVSEVEEGVIQHRARMDLESKLREDPLELIKLREMEKKRDLFENTAKMKRLQKLVKEQKNNSSKKKKKKKKKKRAQSSDSESSSDSSDDELLNKFVAILKSKEGASNNPKAADITAMRNSSSPDKRRDRSRSSDRQRNQRSPPVRNLQRRSRSPVRHRQTAYHRPTSSERIRRRSPGGQRKKSRSPDKRRNRSRSPDTQRKRSSSPERLRKRSRSPDKRKKRSRSPERLRKRSRSPDKRKNRSRSPDKQRKRSRSPLRPRKKSKSRSTSPNGRRKLSTSNSPDQKRNRSPDRQRKRSRSFDRRRPRSKSPDPIKRRSRSPPKSVNSKKRSAEELARLREEMMSAAKSRDEERVTRVSEYRRDCEKEEQAAVSGNGGGAGFIKPMVLGHTAGASVEENVRRRAYTRQKGELDGNFIKRE